jgi:TetR/AcrR family transcriptional regulator, fatty acid metabolism regulator protein
MADRDATSGIPERKFPPGKVKIMEALRHLLEQKEFASITTSELAQTAGVTEGLIYKYFKDKRDLLHAVLADYVDFFINRMEDELQGVEGALNKLRKVIRIHMAMYAHNRVFSRILLLEVRNHPDYFQSEAYETVTRYTSMLLEIIKEGMAEGSVRRDIPASAVRQVILGGIEHTCLPNVLFHRSLDPQEASERLCDMIFQGITQSGPPRPQEMGMDLGRPIKGE